MNQIEGVHVYDVPCIADHRGMVIKVPLPSFQVKDVYVTTVRKGSIKAWHGYETKILFWTALSGLAKLVLIDQRDYSPTFGVIDEIYLGTNVMKSVQVPCGVYNGFQGIEESTILVQASETYGQIYRLPVKHFDYDWMWNNG